MNFGTKFDLENTHFIQYICMTKPTKYHADTRRYPQPTPIRNGAK